ncbi:MAG: hypothetical protein ABJB86_15710 [Bacteroidota bacterium]
MKSGTISQVKTAQLKEDNFARTLLEAFKNKNLDAWIALFPNNDEYKGILQAGLAAKAEGLTQQIIDDIIVRRKKEAAAEYAKRFNNYCALADSVGISWKDVVLEKFDFADVYPEPVKLKYLDGAIWFKCKKKHFVLDGIQAVEIASGYKLQALAEFRQVGDGE